MLRLRLRWLVFLFAGSFLGGCDYWAPPLLDQMVQQGGAFLVYWEPDGSAFYQVAVFDPLSRPGAVDTVAEQGDTLYLYQYVSGVELTALDSDYHSRGFASYWSAGYVSCTGEFTLHSMQAADSASDFAVGFDSTGAAQGMDFRDFYRKGLMPAVWVDSTGTRLVAGADSCRPDETFCRCYLALADSTVLDSNGIAAPPDTAYYRTSCLLADSAAYWLWFDNGSAGYDEADLFAVLRVRMLTRQRVEMRTAYQRRAGCRWLGRI